MSPTFRFTIRVYYEDTDFSGVVYHASYLRFLERGRTEFLRAHGIHHSALHAADGSPIAFAVRKMGIDFIKPARMDDELTVETRVAKVGGASVEMAQRILRGDEVLIEADVRIAVVGDGKAQRLPADILGRLEASRG